MKSWLAAAALCALLATAWTDYPPAPHSGGAHCKYNAQCGVPAADCSTLREQCASLTGSCNSTGRCACDANMFGCPNCAGQSTLVRNATDPSQFYYTMNKTMLDGSGRSIDTCSFGRGGASCRNDAQCGGNHGLCIGGSCVCFQGFVCGNCTITESDMLYGLTCQYPDGGGSCKTNADCHAGQCLRGFCQCNPLVACAHCTQNTTALAKGQATCP